MTTEARNGRDYKHTQQKTQAAHSFAHRTRPEFFVIKVIMDPYALMMLWNTCKNTNQHGVIDRLIQPFFSGDPDGLYLSFFDVLKKDNQDMVHPYDLIYIFTFAMESDDDEDMETTLAMSAMILSCNCRGDFIVHQHLNWERHVKLLLKEGLFK